MIERTATKSQARRFLVRYHGLSGRQKSGKAGVMAVFGRLGSLQYDPLNVVGRNADLVLQSRVKHYSPKLLSELLYREHKLVDGWDKEMSIYPAADFNRFAPLRERAESVAHSILVWREQTEALQYLDEVRAFIRAHGPSAGADIPLGSVTRGRWGPAWASSAALDYLFHRGELCVADKKGTVKRYDFPERVLPGSALAAPGFSDEASFLRWYIERRVAGTGLLWNKNGGGWLGLFLEKKDVRTPVLEVLLHDEILARVRVEGIKEPFFCRSADLPLLDGGPVEKRVRFLAPLDNMLWDRGMIQTLFGFSYTWEVYVPAEKRKFGYYVLPILCGDEFMGRFEPEPYRGGGFHMKQIWFEPGFRMTKTKQAALNAAMEDFAAYLSRS